MVAMVAGQEPGLIRKIPAGIKIGEGHTLPKLDTEVNSASSSPSPKGTAFAVHGA